MTRRREGPFPTTLTLRKVNGEDRCYHLCLNSQTDKKVQYTIFFSLKAFTSSLFTIVVLRLILGGNKGSLVFIVLLVPGQGKCTERQLLQFKHYFQLRDEGLCPHKKDFRDQSRWKIHFHRTV